jgi:hypothetical protein
MIEPTRGTKRLGKLFRPECPASAEIGHSVLIGSRPGTGFLSFPRKGVT